MAANDTLSKRLNAARTAMNPPVTQRDVARKLELSPSTISLWERGTNQPSAEHIVKLSRWFGVSTDWLLGAEDSTPASRVVRSADITVEINTVPIVPPSAMLRWRWDATDGAQQTRAAYPPGTAVACVVSGDAMSATLPSGGIAVVSKAATIKDGSIVAAVASPGAKEPVFRRFVQEGGSDMLMADDPRYPTIHKADGPQIIGVVVEVWTCRVLA